MCGIVGYIGNNQAAPFLLDGMSKLEYRGYDSAGIAVYEKGKITVEKCVGRLDSLRQKLDGHMPEGTMGIGHTRWATHGRPSDRNSHPHTDASGEFVVVHNGIIENYKQIKDFLVEEGYSFVSETDTETVAKLLDYYYVDDPVDTIIKVLAEIKGSYALGIMFRDYPDTVFAVRKESPLIVGVGENENFLASDVPAIIKYTRDYYLLEANEIAVVKKDSVQIYDMHKEPVHKEINTADWDVDAAEKGGYEHFMLKEIHEQPAAVRDTVSPRIINGMPDLSQDGVDMQKLKEYRQIFIVACGTAMHAGMVGKYVIEKLARKPVIVDIASEFRYRDPIITKDDLMIVISQSGETADTMAVLRLAKEVGAATLAVVNVVGSSIAREADMVIYTHAGPEISVASTKAYMVQISVMYLLAFELAYANGTIDKERCMELTAQLGQMPDIIRETLELKDTCSFVASKLVNAESLLYIGRGLDYALSMEGSLKLKEISYIHSESYAAGELKHGTISLITEGMPVIAVATQKKLIEKTVSNIREVKARGAMVILICDNSIEVGEGVADYIIRLPQTDEQLMPMAAAAPLQLIAYYTSVLKGNDVDKPRNLAKSVTVE